MNTEHTPAPWTYSPQKGIPGHCNMAQVWRPDNKPLADVEPTKDEAEATANARLIAASPDLLTALSDLVFECEKEREEGLYYAYDDNKWFELLQRANTAIEKATIPNRPQQ